MMYFDNSGLVETKKGNHDRMKFNLKLQTLIIPFIYIFSLHHTKNFA